MLVKVFKVCYERRDAPGIIGTDGPVPDGIAGGQKQKFELLLIDSRGLKV